MPKQYDSDEPKKARQSGHQTRGEHTQRIPVAAKPRKKAEKGGEHKGLFHWLWSNLDEHVDHDGDHPQAILTTRKKPPHFALCVAVTSFKITLALMLVFAFIGGGALFGIAQAYVNTAPDLDLQTISSVALSSQIYDVNGNLLTTYSGGQNRLWAAYEEIPENLKNAVIATEDARFLSHNGVDLKRIVGSFISNLSSSSVQGATTITQQLIKNRMLTPERSYRRKIQEAYLALELEQQYNKEQILEAYLNDVNLSQGNYGIKSAAKDYFGKDLSQLTLRECAMLAGMIQSPTTYDPRRNYYVRNRPELTDNRTNTVLSRMFSEGYITSEQYNAALTEKVTVLEEKTNTSLGTAPSFVDYVIKDVIDHFLEARNLPDTSENRNAIDHELRTSGYRIYTTMDPVIQQAAEDCVYNYKNYPKMRSPKDSTSRDGTLQPQASVTVYDYRNGEIVAMVGGRTPPTGLKVLNRAYMAHMPVGSSIKPLAVYGPALEYGLGCGTIIQNLKGAVTGWGGYPYPGKTLAPVTMRTAIVQSLNVSAARTLMEMSGDNALDNSVAYLEKLGIDTDEKYIKKTGAGLALGTNGISSKDEAVAFGAIGNKGESITAVSFSRIEDGNGNIVLDAKAMQTRTQAFQPSTAWMLVDMLTSAVQGGTGSRAKVSGITVAGKTGTNDEYRGVTFAGITPHYSAAVWIGSDEYNRLAGSASGGTYAAPLFSQIMTRVYREKALQNQPIIADSPQSLGLVKGTVCRVSGMRPTEACALDAGGFTPVTDWFLSGTVPTESCTYHRVISVCADSKLYATQYCPNHTESAHVFVPSGSVLARCDLSELPWYHLGEENVTEETNPEKFCNLHNAQTNAQGRTAAISEANAILTNAQSTVNARKAMLPKATYNAFMQLVTMVHNTIADVATTPEQIRTAAAAVQSKANEIAAQYPLTTATPKPTEGSTPGDD